MLLYLDKYKLEANPLKKFENNFTLNKFKHSNSLFASFSPSEWLKPAKHKCMLEILLKECDCCKLASQCEGYI